MANKVVIDPITRIEGHYSIEIEIENGKIKDAWARGDMFRGWEIILQGRDPQDAINVTQRICGVCPVAHAMASAKTLDSAFNVTPPDNGRIIRNLMAAGNLLHSHILHFYNLVALDFVDITAILDYKGNDPTMNNIKEWVKKEVSTGRNTAAAPFLPRYKGDYIKDNELNLTAISHYVKAFEMARTAQEMMAIWGGKMPHVTGIVPGGVAEIVTAEKIASYLYRLRKIKDFIDSCYIPDVIAVAKSYPNWFKIGGGYKNLLAYGIFELNNEGTETYHIPGAFIEGKLSNLDQKQIKEEVFYSKYSSPTGLHPFDGETTPDPKKPNAYTWVKAARYETKPMEVGPLARMAVTHLSGKRPEVSKLVKNTLSLLHADESILFSVLGRHACRALELKVVAEQVEKWLLELKPNEPTNTPYEVPKRGEGFGLTEAQRGALGHWIKIRDHKIERYQCVVPSTWNCGPRDDKGVRGVIEEALIGTPIADPQNPIEAVRVVRSFDPCLACAIHVIMPESNEIKTFKVS